MGVGVVDFNIRMPCYQQRNYTVSLYWFSPLILSKAMSEITICCWQCLDPLHNNVSSYLLLTMSWPIIQQCVIGGATLCQHRRKTAIITPNRRVLHTTGGGLTFQSFVTAEEAFMKWHNGDSCACMGVRRQWFGFYLNWSTALYID